MDKLGGSGNVNQPSDTPSIPKEQPKGQDSRGRSVSSPQKMASSQNSKVNESTPPDGPPPSPPLSSAKKGGIWSGIKNFASSLLGAAQDMSEAMSSSSDDFNISDKEVEDATPKDTKPAVSQNKESVSPLKQARARSMSAAGKLETTPFHAAPKDVAPKAPFHAPPEEPAPPIPMTDKEAAAGIQKAKPLPALPPEAAPLPNTPITEKADEMLSNLDTAIKEFKSNPMNDTYVASARDAYYNLRDNANLTDESRDVRKDEYTFAINQLHEGTEEIRGLKSEIEASITLMEQSPVLTDADTNALSNLQRKLEEIDKEFTFFNINATVDELKGLIDPEADNAKIPEFLTKAFTTKPVAPEGTLTKMINTLKGLASKISDHIGRLNDSIDSFVESTSDDIQANSSYQTITSKLTDIKYLANNLRLDIKEFSPAETLHSLQEGTEALLSNFDNITNLIKDEGALGEDISGRVAAMEEKLPANTPAKVKENWSKVVDASNTLGEVFAEVVRHLTLIKTMPQADESIQAEAPKEFNASPPSDPAPPIPTEANGNKSEWTNVAPKNESTETPKFLKKGKKRLTPTKMAKNAWKNVNPNKNSNKSASKTDTTIAEKRLLQDSILSSMKSDKTATEIISQDEIDQDPIAQDILNMIKNDIMNVIDPSVNKMSEITNRENTTGKSVSQGMKDMAKVTEAAVSRSTDIINMNKGNSELTENMSNDEIMTIAMHFGKTYNEIMNP